MIKVFHHIYGTDEGRRIASEQEASLGRMRLISGMMTNYLFYIEPVGGSFYEGRTLEQLHSFSQEEDFDVLYIHTKGASVEPGRRTSYNNWRRVMEEVVIHDWKHCIEQLATCDCYGAHLPTDGRYFFPGNFWWSKASHIRTLPPPKEWAEKICGRTGVNVRYGYEDWITLSREGVVAKAKYPWKP